MPRRKSPTKIKLLPDPLFKQLQITRLINTVMKSGKKSVAERIVYGALDIVAVVMKGGQIADMTKPRAQDAASIYNSDAARAHALEYLDQAMANIMPVVEVRSRRVGGSTYQVPVEVRSARRVALGMKWLIGYAQKRSEKSMVSRLANELMDAIAGRGAAVKKREEVHRMAEANKAFSHFNW